MKRRQRSKSELLVQRQIYEARCSTGRAYGYRCATVTSRNKPFFDKDHL
jgi:hypothetical protein